MAGDSKQVFSISSLLLGLSFLPAVQGSYSADLAGLVASGVVAFFFFAIFIIVLVVKFTWDLWFPAVQRSKNRVKMPRSYWKEKKRLKKLRKLELARASRITTSTVLPPIENGGMNGYVTDIVRARDTASWIQGWNRSNRPHSTAYEELAVAMELDEEHEEPHYRIVTNVEKDNQPITTTTTITTTGPTDDLERPSSAYAVVKDHTRVKEVRSVQAVRVLNAAEPANPISSTSVRTGSTKNEKEKEDPSQFRIVAAVVDDEALDLGPFKSTETQTGKRGGGEGGRGGISDQTVTISLDKDEDRIQGSSYSHFLDSSRVAF